MSRQATFLKSVLNEANLYKRQQQLRHANTDQINAVCELLMNTLRGAVPKGRQTLTANPRQSIKRRRGLMMH